ncbi:MAG: YkvA family protein [Saprospiraceae bacterium]
MKNNLNPYKKFFSENRFWQKIKKYAQQAGSKTIYMALLLFYAYRRKETPGWAKHIMLGALGYLISPIDALPDLSPILGYTDDAGVLAFALVIVSGHINDAVKEQAREKLNGWFPQVDERALNDIDEEYS